MIGHNLECNYVMKIFNRTLVFDFGSRRTVVCDEDGQVVFYEPTLILIWGNGKTYIGDKARLIYDSYDYSTFRPIEEGRIVNQDHFDAFAKGVCRKLVPFPRLRLKTAIIAVPGTMIDDKDTLKAFSKPFKELGVKDIKFIPQSIGALYGAQKAQ